MQTDDFLDQPIVPRMSTVGDLIDACKELPRDALVVMVGFSVYWRLVLRGRRAPIKLRRDVKCLRSCTHLGTEPALVLEVA